MSEGYSDDKEILEIGREILSSESSALEDSRDMILEVLKLMLQQERTGLKTQIQLSPEHTTALEGRLYDRIAAVIAKTYIGLGESAALTNNQAMEMICDLLLQFDQLILLRNKHRPLQCWRLKRRW